MSQFNLKHSTKLPTDTIDLLMAVSTTNPGLKDLVYISRTTPESEGKQYITFHYNDLDNLLSLYWAAGEVKESIRQEKAD